MAGHPTESRLGLDALSLAVIRQWPLHSPRMRVYASACRIKSDGLNGRVLRSSEGQC